MNPTNIDDRETLFRAVKKSYPNAFIDGKPSPALFIDGKGLSVSRDGGRTENEVVEVFRNKFVDSMGNPDYAGCVKITAKECRDAETFPTPIKNKNDIYHAEIHDSPSIVEIPLLKAARLCAACKIV